VLRLLLWRLAGLLALLVGIILAVWLLGGGLGRALRGQTPALHNPIRALTVALGAAAREAWRSMPALVGPGAARTALAAVVALPLLAVATRSAARRRRRYVRLRVEPYRTDEAAAEAVVAMFAALHKRLLRRWWRRLALGQPSVALEVHNRVERGPAGEQLGSAWMAISCPAGCEQILESALRGAYPNCRLAPFDRGARTSAVSTCLLRLKKDAEFIRRVKGLDRFEHAREPAMNRLLTAMGACGEPALVQIALTPAPVAVERFARRLFKARERRLSRERRARAVPDDRSIVEDAELRAGLDVQHRALFFADIRVCAADRAACELIASELRAESAENRLVERGAALRHGVLSVYRRRIERGEGNPFAPLHRGVYATTELAAMWHLPSIDYALVPFARSALPIAPAPPSILRPPAGEGTLRDALGPVSIQRELRKQNTAVPGAVEQGKTSYLIATVAEDLRRERCAVIVLDPKGDAADAAVSLVPPERVCTLLDFAHPTCGFNPLAVDAPADVIADYVVAALKHLFTDADIRASSDRYLRNAIIAVLAADRTSTLWDAARLLSVGEEGYAYRRAVGARVRGLPEFKEISEFFTAELTAQLADARSMTTAKLDAPVNKLARLLNSASIKRVLLNTSLTVDFDRIISEQEALVVKGALGAMGAGNTSVLMQLLVGMLDAALARQQDMVAGGQRVSVALKVDEAPLVLNAGFAETMALKRSAGLETVACWQSDAQWTDREIRDQLDALFAHRVYFATASARDARAAVELTMAEFSDTVRPGLQHISKLGRPDARLHLPKHHAIASWTTAEGRQAPFVASTIPLRTDRRRIALHAEHQRDRGGRHLDDLRQPHWQRGPQRSHGTGPHAAIGVAQAPSDLTPDYAAPRSDGAAGPGRPVVCGATAAADRPPGHGGDAAPDATVGQVRDRAGSQAALAPAVPTASYRELAELDGAQSARFSGRARSPRAVVPDPLDLAILELMAQLRHVLSSQLHRRFNDGRAMTTTQRRLKRLSDAHLIERFQFHRRDGGGVPMCCAIGERGVRALETAGHIDTAVCEQMIAGLVAARSNANTAKRLRGARRDVHVAGWTLALISANRDLPVALRGPELAVMEPPARVGPGGQRTIGPADLRLPGGRVPHDFLGGAEGGDVEVTRFDTIRPDAIVELEASRRRLSSGADHDEDVGARDCDRRTGEVSHRGLDVLVDFDDRLTSPRWIARLQRYDHFLAGWSVHTRRYGERREAEPLVVFVCRDRRRARACARAADGTLRACRAYAGEYPFDWEYPGRAGVLFAAERDLHEGRLCAYGVPRLPPSARVLAAHGEPGVAEAAAEACQLPRPRVDRPGG
jgi:Replication-relaxation